MNVERLTARTHDGHAYLANVKDDEQEVECASRNTAQCIMDSWERLAAYEDTGLSPADIATLTARAEAAEAERDAAVEDLKLALIDETLDPCHCCEYGRTNHCTHPDGPTCGETDGKNWQWRGPQAGKGGSK